MHMHPHKEHHFTASEIVRDIVIGMSDGLTVPFALAAGLSGAIASNGIVVTAGLAEIAAGSIAMGLGGYLSARGDAEHYANERLREQTEIVEKPQMEMQEITDIFADYGISEAESATVVQALAARPEPWVDFMMRFELGLEKPDPRRALTSAVVIGGSYIAGGLVPLVPYMVITRDHSLALEVSAIVTLLALFIFGYFKGRVTTSAPFRSALQTVIIGGIAAAAAFLIARAIS